MHHMVAQATDGVSMVEGVMAVLLALVNGLQAVALAWLVRQDIRHRTDAPKEP